MSFKLLKTLFGVHVRGALDDFVQAAVMVDPQAAGDAQIQLIKEEMEEVATLVAKLRAQLKKEKEEAAAARKEVDRLMMAADHLEKKIEATADEDLKAELRSSLDQLVARLEEADADLVREEKDVVDVESLLNQASERLSAKGKELANAAREHERALRDVQRADMDRQRAADRARDAERVAGLQNSGASQLTSAREVLQSRAARAREEAEALDLRTDAILNMRNAAAGDKHVQAALAEVDAGPSGGGGSTASRLQALRDRRGT